MAIGRYLLAATAWLAGAGILAAEEGTMATGVAGHWTFDGHLRDASGRGHDATGAGTRFAAGENGRALSAGTVSIPSSPDLELFPGLTVECTVRFDTKPDSYVNLVRKENAYLLRVDHPQEGGNLSFFTFLDGWEPRLKGPVPEPGVWYRIVARWTGTEMILEVNGDRVTAHRGGSALPAESSLEVGEVPGRLDDLRVLNPGMLDREWATARVAAAGGRIARDRFGAGADWAGWEALRGARATAAGETQTVTFDRPGAAFANASLDADVSRLPYILLDAVPEADCDADLLFLTTAGYGLMPIRLHASGRTTAVLAAHHPAWRGNLRLLAVVPRGETAAPRRVRFESVRVSAEQTGKPFLYIRGLSPGRAILRVGREEEIVAVVRNVDGPAGDARFEIEVPAGMELLDPAQQSPGALAHDATVPVRWRVRAAAPLTGTVRVRAGATGSPTAEAEIPVRVRPALAGPPATYVPEPRPAKTDYTTLMHYCPLWKLGTHYGWNKIELWPDRIPAIGFYDEGTPEVADWHIKYALEHGINGFIYCWYRANLEPEITEMLGHALHDGMLNAKYLDRFTFSIMWENGCAEGVRDREDLMRNVLPYWIKHFFSNPSYLRVDGKIVLFVWRPERVSPQLGGVEATREVFEEMRAACREAGLGGLTLIGCVETANRPLLERMAKEGWDATSAYATWGARTKTFETDPDGLLSVTHEHFMEGQKDVWLGKKEIGALPDIVAVMMGWDKRPWFGKQATFYTRDVDPKHFEKSLREARQIIDATPGNGLDRRLLVLDNWDEFGEGHYLEPCTGQGFGFVDAVRSVFCDEPEPHEDIIPEDVGLEPPDRVYRAYRKIMFPNGPGVNRSVRDNLVARWEFDGDDEHVARDSSASEFHAFKHDFKSGAGVSGKAFVCDGGAVALDADPLFFPLTGVTVSLWGKTDVPDQQDHWMINTVSRGNNGYRLGVGGGHVVWQVPQGQWSHALSSPEKMPLDRWVHIAATFDNRVMRLYLDGVEVASMEREGLLVEADSSITIGSFATGMDRAAFRGLLDDVRIYDRPLTPAEIARQAKR